MQVPLIGWCVTPHLPMPQPGSAVCNLQSGTFKGGPICCSLLLLWFYRDLTGRLGRPSLHYGAQPPAMWNAFVQITRESDVGFARHRENLLLLGSLRAEVLARKITSSSCTLNNISSHTSGSLSVCLTQSVAARMLITRCFLLHASSQTIDVTGPTTSL